MCVAVGNGGTILVTQDGGTSWHSQLVTTTNLQAITCLTSSRCVAVGSNGAILATGLAGPAPVPGPTQPVRQTCPQGQGTGTRVTPVSPAPGTRLPLATPVAFAWKPFCQATNYVLQVWLAEPSRQPRHWTSRACRLRDPGLSPHELPVEPGWLSPRQVRLLGGPARCVRQRPGGAKPTRNLHACIGERQPGGALVCA